ncbi:Actin-related protein 2/3 complex subunit 4 [Paecilomyces lecythidis]|uniref:Actin-related protein 2/3 complex subunit 4 n=1 Tax=Paecilomyces lecythidis TaxID=3004212 RepID=A0ABR3Y0Q5_9EURO
MPSDTASEPGDYYLDSMPTRHPGRISGLRCSRTVCTELGIPPDHHTRAEFCTAMIETAGKDYIFEKMHSPVTVGEFDAEVSRRRFSDVVQKSQPRFKNIAVGTSAPESGKKDVTVPVNESGEDALGPLNGSVPVSNNAGMNSTLWRTPTRYPRVKEAPSDPTTPESPTVSSLTKLFNLYCSPSQRFVTGYSMAHSVLKDDPFTIPGQPAATASPPVPPHPLPPSAPQLSSYGNPPSQLIPHGLYGMPVHPYMASNQNMAPYGYLQGPWAMNPQLNANTHVFAPPAVGQGPMNHPFHGNLMPLASLHPSHSPHPLSSPQPNVYSTLESPASFISSVAPSQQDQVLQALEQSAVPEIPYQNVNVIAPPSAASVNTVAFPTEMPIGSLVHYQGPPTAGVLKVGNIPYGITKQEIMQFLGRQARVLRGDPGSAIHIIMERSTAKTMDCYVELETPQDVQDTVFRINRVQELGRPPRLGARHVDVEISSQDVLLKELFPRAKCVVWRDGRPQVMPNTDPYSTGFQGFFTGEEIVGMVRHAETPQRVSITLLLQYDTGIIWDIAESSYSPQSPFASKCPQRTYECMISTLYKFPWHAAGLYTVDDRNTLFNACVRQLKALVTRVRRSRTMGLDHRLVQDLLAAGLNCPAFNDRMKFTLVAHSGNLNDVTQFPGSGKYFPFDTLVRMPGFNESTLMYYARLISKSRDPGSEDLPNTYPTHGFPFPSPYGRLWLEWKKDSAKRKSWEEAVKQEMDILTSLVLDGWAKVEQGRSGGHLASTPASLPGPRASSSSGRASTDGSGSIIVNGQAMQPTAASDRSSSGSSVRRHSVVLGQRRGHYRDGARSGFDFSAFLEASGFASHRGDLTMSSPARLPPPIETEYE